MQINDSFIPVIHTFDFIDSEEMSQASIKAVLGVVVSSLSEETARDFTAHLPDWLDFETLWGNQEDRTASTPEDCKEMLKNTFNFDDNQAEALMYKVISIAVQEEKGSFKNLMYELPDEWEEVFDQSPKQENIKDDTVY